MASNTTKNKNFQVSFIINYVISGTTKPDCEQLFFSYRTLLSLPESDPPTPRKRKNIL
jgi:hypothetical protein